MRRLRGLKARARELSGWVREWEARVGQVGEVEVGEDEEVEESPASQGGSRWERAGTERGSGWWESWAIQECGWDEAGEWHEGVQGPRLRAWLAREESRDGAKALAERQARRPDCPQPSVTRLAVPDGTDGTCGT